MAYRTLAILTIYALNTFLKKHSLGNEFSFYYLNDFLFVPFVIEFTKAMFCWLPKLAYKTNWVWETGITVVVAIILFEIVQPFFDRTATRDYLDCIMYILGGLLPILFSHLRNKLIE